MTAYLIRRARRARLAAAAVVVVGGATFTVAQTRSAPPTVPYDHIHLNVPDATAAATWYETHFGGRRIAEAPNRLMYGSTRLMFLSSKTAQPSAGSAIDHLGFSVKDLAATMKALEAAGVKVTTPLRVVEGLFPLAFVEDPWGTRIEVVEDPDLLGLHHLHLRGPDPDQVLAWLVDKFGGERAQLKERLDGLKYSTSGFSTVWILVQRGDAVPSMGRAIDHIGWRSVKPLGETVADMKAKSVEVTSEPRPLTLPNGPPINFSYVAGPNGARIELVERPGLAPGQ